MNGNLSSKFAHLSVRSEKACSDDLSGFHRTNGEEEKGAKGNPWKPTLTVPSSGSNVLEADAWPEPSAPTEQRRVVARVPEEKPKRKLKWHNYEVDDTSCGFSRGRGRQSVNQYSGSAYIPGSNVRSFRRGFGGYRTRAPAENNRGRGSNGYYARQSSRINSIRQPFEQQEQPLDSQVKVKVGSSDDQTVVNSDAEPSDVDVPVHKTEECSSSGDQAQHGVNDAPVSSAPSRQSESESSNNRTNVSNQSTLNRKTYRDRALINSQVNSQISNMSPNYDAGPAGRARRSYQRQQQPAYADLESSISAHSNLVANPPIPALLPIPTIPQFAYIIPGNATTMLNATLQLPQAPHAVLPGNIPAVSVANTPIIPAQPSVQHAVASLPHIPVASLPISILPDISTLQHVPQGINPQTTIMPTPVQSSELSVEVVDVNQMIGYINEVGWKRVSFPISLREHPAVAASIRDSLSHSNKDVAKITELINKSEVTPLPPVQARSEDGTAKPVKAEDVVIVEDKVFFVPRNVNRTKFLKFISKLDYIRHHVEYYFSESNLQRDSHLFSLLAANQDVCPLIDLLQFNRLRWVSTTESELLEAVSTSQLLTVVFVDKMPVGISRVSTFGKQLNENPSPVVDNSFPRTTYQVTTEETTIVSDPDQCVNTLANQSVMSLVSAATQSQSSSLSSQTTTVSSTSSVPVNVNFPIQTICPLPSNQLANYIQTSTYNVNPTNLGTFSSPTISNNVYSTPSNSQPNVGASMQVPQFYQPDANIRSSQHTVVAPQFYSQLQAAALVASAANQSGMLTPCSSNSNLPTVDPNSSSFMTAPYRFASSGNPPQILGTYVPAVGSPIGLGAATNSAVLLQLIPGTHPNQPNAYFTPVSINYPTNTTLINRPVAANAGGMWIPFNTCSNASASTQQLHSYMTLPQGYTNLTLPTSNNNLHSTGPPMCTAVPVVSVRSDVSVFGNPKMSAHMYPRTVPHPFTNHQSVGSSGSNVTLVSSCTAPSPINNVSATNHSVISQSSSTLGTSPASMTNAALPQQTSSLLLNKR